MKLKSLLLCSILLQAAPVYGQQLVAIYPLQSEGVEAETLAHLDELLRRVSGQLSGISVQSKGKTNRAIARATGKKRECHRQLGCLVAVGELSSASIVIYGTAGQEPAGYRVDLRTIDVAEEKIVQRGSVTLAGDARAIADGMRNLVASLLLRYRGTGTLVVSMLVPGARVLLDGLEVGTTPLEPVRDLSPRAYEFEIELAGAPPLKRTLHIGHGTTTVVRVEVVENHLVADLQQESRLADERPPRAAVVLADALAASGIAPPPPAPEDGAEQGAQVAAAPAPEVEVEAASAEEQGGDAEPLPWLGISVGLVGAGALASLIGTIGLATNAVAWLQTAAATDGEVVSDQATYDALTSGSDFYQGLGVVGGVALALGVAAIAGGAGLWLWQGRDSMPEDGVDD